MEIRPLTHDERKYTYRQSTQLESQTGIIGHLRGDFGSAGNEFWTTWFDVRADLNSEDFKSDIDETINALREGGELLSDRRTMRAIAESAPNAGFKGNYCTEYGFRADTDKYAFLFRCNPVKGDYNFYCYCYVKEWLDRHIERAQQDIRFIDSSYGELFRLPDGEKLQVTDQYGEVSTYTCRFIDEYHVEVGNNLYHICQFAESMERNGCTYEPKETPLPRECLSTLQSTGELIKIDRYTHGYTPRGVQKTPEENRRIADAWNAHHGVTKAQEAAMVGGSMFGWDAPIAKPDNYNRDGKPIMPDSRGQER